VILFDTANTIYRMALQRDMATLRTSDGRPSGYIYGIDTAVKRLWANHRGPTTSIVFGWDSPTAKEVRRKVMPEYKAQRDDRKDLFMEYFGLPKPRVFADVREFVETLPGHILESPDAEFDDLAAAMVRENPKKQFILVSNDKDLWQLLCYDNIMICGSQWNPVGDAELDKAFGLNNFNQVFLYKALFGDPSDNIPSVLPRVVKKGIIEEVIKPLAGVDHVPTSVMEKLLECSSKRAVEITKEYGFEEKLERNMAVVGFIDGKLTEGALSAFRPSNISAYYQMLDRYEIRS
jgi:5'-3' exonuclease